MGWRAIQHPAVGRLIRQSLESPGGHCTCLSFGDVHDGGIPMAKASKPSSTRKPPEPAESHAVIQDRMEQVMPRLKPIVERVDGKIGRASCWARVCQYV